MSENVLDDITNQGVEEQDFLREFCKVAVQSGLKARWKTIQKLDENVEQSFALSLQQNLDYKYCLETNNKPHSVTTQYAVLTEMKLVLLDEIDKEKQKLEELIASLKQEKGQLRSSSEQKLKSMKEAGNREIKSVREDIRSNKVVHDKEVEKLKNELEMQQGIIDLQHDEFETTNRRELVDLNTKLWRQQKINYDLRAQIEEMQKKIVVNPAEAHRPSDDTLLDIFHLDQIDDIFGSNAPEDKLDTTPSHISGINVNIISSNKGFSQTTSVRRDPISSEATRLSFKQRTNERTLPRTSAPLSIAGPHRGSALLRQYSPRKITSKLEFKAANPAQGLPSRIVRAESCDRYSQKMANNKHQESKGDGSMQLHDSHTTSSRSVINSQYLTSKPLDRMDNQKRQDNVRAQLHKQANYSQRTSKKHVESGGRAAEVSDKRKRPVLPMENSSFPTRHGPESKIEVEGEKVKEQLKHVSFREYKSDTSNQKKNDSLLRKRKLYRMDDLDYLDNLPDMSSQMSTDE